MADDAQSVPTPDEPAPAETVPTPATTVTESVAPAEPTPEVVPEVSQSAGQATKSADSPVDGVPESESILKNELRHNALAQPPKRGLARAV